MLAPRLMASRCSANALLSSAGIRVPPHGREAEGAHRLGAEGPQHDDGEQRHVAGDVRHDGQQDARADERRNGHPDDAEPIAERTAGEVDDSPPTP